MKFQNINLYICEINIFTKLLYKLRSNYEKYYLRAQKVRRLISEDFTKVFEAGVDLLLTPTALTTAPLYSCFSKADNRTRTIEQDILTTSVNLAGSSLLFYFVLINFETN